MFVGHYGVSYAAKAAAERTTAAYTGDPVKDG